MRVPAEPADSFASQVLPYALYRMQANAFYGACRTRRRRPREIALDAIELAVRERMAVAGATSSAEDVALARMPDPAVRQALRSLPRVMMTTVLLADVAEHSYAEIATLTGAPIGTVMSRLHRGRKRLRLLLSRQARPAAPGPQSRAAAPAA